MCGIVGYVGQGKIVSMLLDGLKNLEYRGYDSSGIALEHDNRIITIKRKGKVAELLQELASLPEKDRGYGITHTRWATHGEPSETNAHPHLSSDNRIAVVHNGIIENYLALREFLKENKIPFRSETDSEVLPLLINFFYKGNLEQAILNVLPLLQGTFGFLAISNQEEKIVGVKKGSPLVVGISEQGTFFGSDVSAFLEHTKDVHYLKEGEMVVATKDGFIVKDFQNNVVDTKIEKVTWTIGQIQKGNFKHFMHKEIHEQPRVIRDAFAGRISPTDIRIDGMRELGGAQFINKIKRIIFLGCGTSKHAAIYAQYLFEKLGFSAHAEDAAEWRYRNPHITKEDFIVAISQSGETADTLEAIRLAKSKGATTFGVVNVVGSSIAREVDTGIYIHAGPEIGVASTKAFTTQMICLYLLGIYCSIHSEKLLIDLKQVYTNLEKLPDQVQALLNKEDEINSVAQAYKNYHHFQFLGRGLDYVCALEGALKLEEISYLPSKGMSAAEVKHGPIAVVDEDMPIIVLVGDGLLRQKMISNIEELKARKGNVLAFALEGDSAVSTIADHTIFLPKVPHLLSPLISSVAVQLLAYHIANINECEIDKPKNLAKSVTVE